MSKQPIHIIGAGLAGSEAAWQAANAGAKVILHEMRPHVKTHAHETGNAAELVCGEESAITRWFAAEPEARKLPPQPFRDMGGNVTLRWKEWRARRA